MAWQFVWNGSTWTPGIDEQPTLPVDLGQVDGGGDIQRTYAGAARGWYRYQKATLGLTWENVGTNSPAVHARNMISSNGTVTISYHGGTYTTRCVPGSVREQEVGYQLYAITAAFEEV